MKQSFFFVPAFDEYVGNSLKNECKWRKLLQDGIVRGFMGPLHLVIHLAKIKLYN
jgi:hypothetical protein